MKGIFLYLISLTTLISCSENEDKIHKKPIAQDSKILNKSGFKDSISEEKSFKVISQKPSQYNESLTLDNFLVKNITSKDFITITEKTVIFTSPDSKQIKRFKKEIGEEDFYIVADDNSWYQFEAHEFYEKKKINIIHSDKRYIKFITRNKKILNFDTRAKYSGWQTILFRPDSLPKIINPVGIELEDSLYFGN